MGRNVMNKKKKARKKKNNKKPPVRLLLICLYNINKLCLFLENCNIPWKNFWVFVSFWLHHCPEECSITQPLGNPFALGNANRGPLMNDRRQHPPHSSGSHFNWPRWTECLSSVFGASASSVPSKPQPNWFQSRSREIAYSIGSKLHSALWVSGSPPPKSKNVVWPNPKKMTIRWQTENYNAQDKIDRRRCRRRDHDYSPCSIHIDAIYRMCRQEVAMQRTYSFSFMVIDTNAGVVGMTMREVGLYRALWNNISEKYVEMYACTNLPRWKIFCCLFRQPHNDTRNHVGGGL